jgi:hypothetical protein
MALAVVTVAAGGLPVVEVTAFGLPVTEAASGRGLAVTKVVGKPGLPVTFVNEAGQVVPSTVAFDPATATQLALSNGNLTATHNTSNTAGVTVSKNKNSGKFYFEFVLALLGTNGSSICVGFLSSAGAVTEDGSVATNSVSVFFGSNTILYANGVSTAKNFGNRVLNDVWGIAVDFGARLAWFRKNGGNWNVDPTANPATGVGGVTFASASYTPWVRFPGGISGEVVTANFGATAYANAAPSGFNNWPAS